MQYKLIVSQAFGSHKKGEEISDPDTVAEILGDERQAYVNKVAIEPPEGATETPPAG